MNRRGSYQGMLIAMVVAGLSAMGVRLTSAQEAPGDRSYFYVPQNQSHPGYSYPGNMPARPLVPSPEDNWTRPTPEQPYPPGFVVGVYEPVGQINTDPLAPAGRGVIYVVMPRADVEVYMNGQKMRGEGFWRAYTTPTLALDREYQYTIEMRYQANGRMLTDYRKVTLGAGEYNVADFRRPRLNNPIKAEAGPVNFDEAYRPEPHVASGTVNVQER
jgi:uncharacterized protein (TIGR03000 family)